MSRLTFAEVHTAFQSDSNIDTFTCLATYYNTAQGCDLDARQKAVATTILRRPEQSWQSGDIKNVIYCLVCAEHQIGRNYRYTHKVQDQWAGENELYHLDLSRNGYRSPYSLSTIKRRAELSKPSSTLPTPPSSRETTPSSIFAPPDRRLNFGRELSSTALFGHLTPSTPSIADKNEDDEEQVASEPESPSNARHHRINDRRRNRAAIRSDDEVSAISAANTAPEGWENIDTANAPSIRGPESIQENDPSMEQEDNEEQDQPRAIAVDVKADRHATPTNVENHSEVAQQPQTPAARRFTPGDGSTWAPGTLRSEVLDLLFEPLRKKGHIYAVKVESEGNSSMVKIGYTTSSIKQGLKEIARNHGPLAAPLEVYSGPCISILQLIRLEALILTDLAFFQRNLQIQHGGQCKTHREYFEIDIGTAKRVIDMWYAIIDDIGLEPDQEVDDNIIRQVRASPALAVEVSDTAATADETEIWHRLNADHGRRENLWKAVFRMDSGGFKGNRATRDFLWLFFSIFLLLLPSMLGCTASTAYTIFAIALPFLKHWRMW